MGVYIKGEKMPDTCINCFKHNKCDRYHIEIIKTEDGDYMPQYIADNCPLIEVKTPHGKLIDADAEYEALSEMKVEGEVFVTAVEFVKIEMEQAQTVIEAEVE